MVAAVLLLLRLPVRSAPSWLPGLVGLWAGALPLELGLSAVLPLPPLPVEDERLYPDESMRGDERLQGQRCGSREKQLHSAHRAGPNKTLPLRNCGSGLGVKQ